MESLKFDKNEQVILQREGSIFWLILNNKLNPINLEMLRILHKKLDIIEQSEGAACLITVSTNPKVFSCGLDFNYFMTAHVQDTVNLLRELGQFLARFLTFRLPTIALVNGIAVASGLLFALSHDVVIMNEEFGYLWMNEINNGLPIPKSAVGLIQAKLGPTVQRDLLLIGKKFSPKEALERHIVDMIVPLKNLIQTGREVGRDLAQSGEHREVLYQMKSEAYARAVEAGENKGLNTIDKALSKGRGLLKPKL